MWFVLRGCELVENQIVMVRPHTQQVQRLHCVASNKSCCFHDPIWSDPGCLSMVNPTRRRQKKNPRHLSVAHSSNTNVVCLINFFFVPYHFHNNEQVKITRNLQQERRKPNFPFSSSLLLFIYFFFSWNSLTDLRFYIHIRSPGKSHFDFENFHSVGCIKSNGVESVERFSALANKEK